MLGGVQVYREPFLLPMENLPVGLGDTSRHSESKGLQEKSRDQQGLGWDRGLSKELCGSLPQAHGLLRDLWLGYTHGMEMVLRQGICLDRYPSNKQTQN